MFILIENTSPDFWFDLRCVFILVWTSCANEKVSWSHFKCDGIHVIYHFRNWLLLFCTPTRKKHRCSYFNLQNSNSLCNVNLNCETEMAISTDKAKLQPKMMRKKTEENKTNKMQFSSSSLVSKAEQNEKKQQRSIRKWFILAQSSWTAVTIACVFMVLS